MWNDDRTRIQPGLWPVGVCAAVILAALLVTGGLVVSAQERRPRPKLIIVEDLAELSQARGEAAATGKNSSAATVDRSVKAQADTGRTPAGRPLANELARTPALAPRIPPLPKTPSFPAVDKLAPRPDAKSSGSVKSHSGTGVKRDGSPVRTTLSESRGLDKPQSAATLPSPPSPQPVPQGGMPGELFAQAAGEALRPVPGAQEAAAVARKASKQAHHAAADGLAPDVPPTIFAAGRRKGEAVDLATQTHIASPVQPASFSTSEVTQARLGSGPLVVVESAGSPPAFYRTGGESLPAWQIIGVSVAISFTLAMALLAFSLLLLMLRQQPGGSHGSVVRLEIAQAAGGNLTLPFPVTPSMVPPSQPMAPQAPSRSPGRVADFANDILSAAALGSILGEKRAAEEDNVREREESILQQIFEDNVALQKTGA